MSVSIEVVGVSKSFGGVRAVDNCSLKVAHGSITGLIGPNGAGKTTLFNIVAGACRPDHGDIFLDQKPITGQSPNTLFHKGLSRTFQISHEFSNMTSLENLMVVPADQDGENLWPAWFCPAAVHRQERDIEKRANEVLDFLRLSHLKNELAGNLSGGQKKLLELGRTMMANPRIILLDEIAAGVNPSLLNDLTDNILRLNREAGVTFFVIEHDMALIAKLCHPVIVMVQGQVMVEGDIRDIMADPRVIEAYFGGGEAAGSAKSGNGRSCH